MLVLRVNFSRGQLPLRNVLVAFLASGLSQLHWVLAGARCDRAQHPPEYVYTYPHFTTSRPTHTSKSPDPPRHPRVIGGTNTSRLATLTMGPSATGGGGVPSHSADLEVTKTQTSSFRQQL